jgi:fatty acid synthase, animal type
MSNFKTNFSSFYYETGSGDFEVVEKNETLCKGRIQPLEDNNEFVFNTLGDIKINKNKETTLIKEDFYKELRLRGYEYKDEFQLVDISENFVKPQRFGQIEWRNNLISFTDCMVQTFVTNKDIRSLEIPISIERCLFDPVKHLEMIKNKENVQTLLDHDDVVKIVFDLMIDEELNIYRSGGFEIINPEAHNVSRKKNTKNPTLESYEFIPHNESLEMTKNNAAKFCIQLFVENSIYGGKFSFVEVNYEDDNPLIASIVNAVNETPLIVPTYRLLTNQSVEEIKDVIIFNSDELNNLGPIDILITSETNKHILKTLDKINDKGLLLLRKSDSLSISLPESFKPIAKVNCESEIVSVFRKTPIIGTNPQIFEVPSSFESFEWVEEFKKLLELSQDIIIHSRSQCSGALGFFKCLRRESVGEKLRCFIIEDESAPKFDITNEFYKNQLDLGLALNIFKDQRWGSYHHLTISQDIDEKPHSDHVFVHQLTKGDVSSLCWVKGEIENTQSNDIIDVHYSAFNFRDILVATSRISLDYEYSNRITAQYQTGLEFSGIKKDGKRVAGMGESRSFCNYIENCVYFEVPDSYTLEEAATIPVVYATVYLALFIKSQIEPGKSILIHAGSGGLGQAAIRTALNYGLKVFTTCGSKEKREFLLNEFPELEEENIGNSRDLSFEKMIIKRTNGRGVDYVMNSLAEDKMQASLRCLAEGGIFYEVGKFDIHTGNKISLKHFLKEIKYIGIFLTSKLLKGNEKLIEKLNEDMKLGKLKPIKRVVFKANEVEKAFRFMMNGKHTGKVLIQIRENDESQISLPIHVKPRVYFDQEKVYIIPGGLGGMGMEIADWMIMRNCKKIVFSSSRGVSNSYQSYRIK